MEWYKDSSIVLDLANTLVDEGKLATVKDVLYFFEKPWKWDEEYWNHEEARQFFVIQREEMKKALKVGVKN